jgi:hypothetical protein
LSDGVAVPIVRVAGKYLIDEVLIPHDAGIGVLVLVRQTQGVADLEPVTLMGRSDVIENGFPWFKITTQSGKTGYQWGGILCSTGAERPDIFKTCTVKPASRSGTKKPSKSVSKKKKKRCPAGQYLNQNGVCQPNETGQ